MKKVLLSTAVFLLPLFFMSPLFSQNLSLTDKAYQYLQDQFGLEKKAVGELRIKDQYKTDHNGVEHVHFIQVVNGLEVFGSNFNMAILSGGKVAATGHELKLLNQSGAPSARPRVQAPEAIGIVAESFGIATRSAPVKVRTNAFGADVYSKGEVSHQDIPAQLGYILTADGKLALAWKMHIEATTNGQLYQSFVNATTGELIANDQLTLHCSFEHGYLKPQEICEHVEAPYVQAPPPVNAVGVYRALPIGVESPNHGGFEMLTGTEDAQASPYGWHDVNGVEGHEYTSTRGNNVHAFLDRNWDYIPDRDLDGGASLTFDFPYDDAGEPSANQDIAITNLFYWNNLMHDFAFRYGFNEVAGNFQAKNYTGIAGDDDYVEAHAQFGDSNIAQCGQEANGNTPCINNADFATPVDGFNPRMRMFTWDADNSNKNLDVIEPLELSGKILTSGANFGAAISSTPVTGLVVLADDGTSQGSSACNPLTGQPDVEGKIVMIDRGICDFSEKVYYAQEAGAIGAIIVNFEENTVPMGAGINATQVVIPSVMITKSAGDKLKGALTLGLKVSIVLPEEEGGPERRDGALDNSVIAHEYGHGISNRLTGGPGNTSCLSPNAQTGAAEESYGMGEGWSDFFALVTTVRNGDTGNKRRGIGTYSSKEPVEGSGIRSYPYSTDMSENPHTFDDILFESIPHGVGSVWAAMLWDLYWAFVDEYGFDPDLYGGTGGNNIAVQLVFDGLKLQPCNPGFIGARDAILLADEINNGGANKCIIWNAFARRGLGWDADGGDKNKRNDGIEGFASLPECVKELKITKSMTDEINAGDLITVTLYAVNHTGDALTNVTIEDALPDGTSYLDGSANIEPSAGNTLVWTIDEMDPNEEITITYQLTTPSDRNSVSVYEDNMEGDPLERWEIDYDPSKTSTNIWLPQDLIVRSGELAWNVGDVASESDHWIYNYLPFNITGDYPVFKFYHYYDTETGADGGFLEITTDEGDSWRRLETQIFRNGYPRRLQYATLAIPELRAYSGKSGDNFEWTPVFVDLSEYIGQKVQIRFRFGTDDNIGGDGWYLDDVELMDAVIYNSSACITSDQTPLTCAEAPARGTIVTTAFVNITNDQPDNGALSLRPNPAGEFVQIILEAASSENAEVAVFDMTGHLVHITKWNLVNGRNEKVINLNSFTPGMYVVQIQTGAGFYSKKFIKN